MGAGMARFRWHCAFYSGTVRSTVALCVLQWHCAFYSGTVRSTVAGCLDSVTDRGCAQSNPFFGAGIQRCFVVQQLLLMGWGVSNGVREESQITEHSCWRHHRESEP